MTNREALAAMREIDANAEYIENIDRMIASYDTKAAAAKRYKAKHDTNIEAEKKIVLDAVTDEPKTIADILADVSPLIEGITRNKVIARLTALYKDGAIDKADSKNEDGKTVKVYALPGTFDED